MSCRRRQLCFFSSKLATLYFRPFALESTPLQHVYCCSTFIFQLHMTYCLTGSCHRLTEIPSTLKPMAEEASRDDPAVTTEPSAQQGHAVGAGPAKTGTQAAATQLQRQHQPLPPPQFPLVPNAPQAFQPYPGQPLNGLGGPGAFVLGAPTFLGAAPVTNGSAGGGVPLVSTALTLAAASASAPVALAPANPGTAKAGSRSSGGAGKKAEGFKKCTHFAGCRRVSQGSTGLCIAHGGGRRCEAEGCTRGARDKHLCSAHGGGRRCIIEGCGKAAVGGSPQCTSHGGGRRCGFEGCGKSAQSATAFCVRHGGGKQCCEPGCERVARGTTDRCAAHGGGKRCTLEGCGKAAVASTGFCRSHQREDRASAGPPPKKSKTAAAAPVEGASTEPREPVAPSNAKSAASSAVAGPLGVETVTV